MAKLSKWVIVLLVVVPLGVLCQNYQGTGYGTSRRKKKGYYTGKLPTYKRPFISGGGSSSGSYHKSSYSGSSEPYNQKSDPYNQKSDPYNQKSDPYNQKSDPYNQKSDPYNQKSDPYNRKSDPYNRKSDPYNRKSDPYNRKSDPYSSKSDPYSSKSGSYSSNSGSYYGSGGSYGSDTKYSGYSADSYGGYSKPKPMSYKDMFSPTKILQSTTNKHLPFYLQSSSAKPQQTTGYGGQPAYGSSYSPYKKSSTYKPKSYSSSGSSSYSSLSRKYYSAGSSTDAYALQSKLDDALRQLKQKEVEVEALKAKSELQQALVDKLSQKKPGGYSAYPTSNAHDSFKQLGLLLLELDRVSKNTGDILSKQLAQVLLSGRPLPYKQASQLRSVVTDFKAKLLKVVTNTYSAYKAKEITSSHYLKNRGSCETGKVKLNKKDRRRVEVIFQKDFGGYAPTVIYGISAFDVKSDNSKSSIYGGYNYGFSYGFSYGNEKTPTDLGVKVDAYVSPTSVTFDLGYDDPHHLEYVTVTWAACSSSKY